LVQDAGHVVVVDESGQAWSWGNNEFGQLGQVQTIQYRTYCNSLENLPAGKSNYCKKTTNGL
jgi:alpha-tubulin suppressor-like RCC1 family protein